MTSYSAQFSHSRYIPPVLVRDSDASTPSPPVNRFAVRIGREVEQGVGGPGTLYEWFRQEHRARPKVGQPEDAYLVSLNPLADIWHTLARSGATHDGCECFLFTDFAGSRGVTAAKAWSAFADQAYQHRTIVAEVLPHSGPAHRLVAWLERVSVEKADELTDIFVYNYAKHGQNVGQEAGSAGPSTQMLLQMHFHWTSPATSERLPFRDQATADYVATEGLQEEVHTALAKLGDLFPSAYVEVELLRNAEEGEGPILAFTVHSKNLERAEFRRRARGFHEWLREVGSLKLYDLVSVSRA